MKLNEIKPNVVRVGKFDENYFGVGDLSILLDILRAKMYSNPIRTICQEIMCNARDAHREVGKGDVAIEVKLPNSLDDTFYIRDFGPGITPERMSNIFIKYGASTKRSDNNQTGGFGLGAKTPFAYTDSFTIISVTPEHIFEEKNADGSTKVIHENCMVRRQYIAYIDESRIGRMTCASETITNEAQGTTISLTSKPEDFRKFADWVSAIARYWDVKPIIKGTTEFEWPKVVKFAEGQNWFLEERHSDYGNHNSSIVAIIDGIPYPVDSNSLNIPYHSPMSRLFSLNVRMQFKTGEIPVTASREDIDYAKTTTVKIINSRLELILADMKGVLSKMVEDAKNLWDAKMLWKKIRSEFYSIIDNVTWQGIDIDDNDIHTRKYGVGVTRFWYDYRGKLKTSEQYDVLSFTKNTEVYIEDTDSKPSRLRAATRFEENDSLDSVLVVVLPDDPVKRAQAIKDLTEKVHFDKFGFAAFSSVPKLKIQRNSGGNAGITIPRVREYVGGNRKRDAWNSTTLDLINDGGVYVEYRNMNAIINGHTVDGDVISNIKNLLDVPIYGIASRFLGAGKLGQKWVKIEDALKAKVNELLNDPDILQFSLKQGDIETSMERFYYEISSVLSSKRLHDLIVDKNSMFLKFVNLSDSVSRVSSKLKRISELNVYAKVDIKPNSSNVSLRDMKNEFDKTYPMIKHLNNWNNRSMDYSVLADYINMIDEKKAKVSATANP